MTVGTFSRETNSPSAVREVLLDAGLSPLIHRLGLTNPYRLWLIAHSIDTDGRGWVTEAQMRDALPLYGVHYTRRQFDNLIEEGAGILWKVRPTRLRLTGFEVLWERLSTRVSRDVLDAIWSPKLRVYTSVAGTIGDFRATLYSAWIDTRTKDGEYTAVRSTIRKIWNICPKTQWNWDERAGIVVTTNDVQYGGKNPQMIPSYATIYPAKNGENRAVWQDANTYAAPQPFREHAKVGRIRKVRKTRNRVLKAHQPLEKCSEGLADTGRLRFKRDTTQKTFKAILKHVRKHHDPDRRHTAYLGELRGRRKWECYDMDTDLQHTEADDRDPAGAKSHDFVSAVQALEEYGWSRTILFSRWKKITGTNCSKDVNGVDVVHSQSHVQSAALPEGEKGEKKTDVRSEGRTRTRNERDSASGTLFAAPPMSQVSDKVRGGAMMDLKRRLLAKADDLERAKRNGSRQVKRAKELRLAVMGVADYVGLCAVATEYGVPVVVSHRTESRFAQTAPRVSPVPASTGGRAALAARLEGVRDE